MDEDKKLLRTWKEIAEKISAEKDSKRLSKLAVELDKALQRYFIMTRKISQISARDRQCMAVSPPCGPLYGKCRVRVISPKDVPMERKGVRGWKTIPGTLNEWNGRQRHSFRIVQTGGIVNGVQVVGPRIAEDENGRTVAIEHETLLSTNCFVLKNLGKRTDRAIRKGSTRRKSA
jgi:hypothetical protein